MSWCVIVAIEVLISCELGGFLFFGLDNMVNGLLSIYALGDIRSNSAIDATAARRAQVRQQYSQRGRMAGMTGQSIAGG